MAKALAKRFYKTVSIEQMEDGWCVLLDGMQVRTPGKMKLVMPLKALAEIIAEEWDAQLDKINPSTMPVTRLANVACEQTPLRRDDLVEEALRYAKTDLICYRASQPRILIERQAEAWDVWREWAAEQGVDLLTTNTITAIEQPMKSLEVVRNYARTLDDLSLTLFVHLIAVYGSVVLAVAVMKQALDPEKAFDLSRIDHHYQIELWGEDEEQAEIDAALREETKILGNLLSYFN